MASPEKFRDWLTIEDVRASVEKKLERIDREEPFTIGVMRLDPTYDFNVVLNNQRDVFAVLDDPKFQSEGAIGVLTGLAQETATYLKEAGLHPVIDFHHVHRTDYQSYDEIRLLASSIETTSCITTEVGYN